jgi:uncharacterized membrane protein
MGEVWPIPDIASRHSPYLPDKKVLGFFLMALILHTLLGPSFKLTSFLVKLQAFQTFLLYFLLPSLTVKLVKAVC